MKYIQNKFSSHEEQEIFREEIKVRKKRGYPDGKLKIKKAKDCITVKNFTLAIPRQPEYKSDIYDYRYSKITFKTRFRQIANLTE
jgi:hypothetical protein